MRIRKKSRENKLSITVIILLEVLRLACTFLETFYFHRQRQNHGLVKNLKELKWTRKEFGAKRADAFTMGTGYQLRALRMYYGKNRSNM